MRLISFLGLGEAKRDASGKPTGEYIYHQTTYRFNQDPKTDISNTCYVVRAITQGYVLEETVRGQSTQQHRVEEVFLLATEQAEQAHLHKLLPEFEAQSLPQPQIIRVPHGANAGQQWEQFNAILEAIPTGADKKVIFDITHGFRSQPFFAAAVINYVRSTRSSEDIPEMHILYGEYSKEKGVSDIWDMSTFVNLLDWSSALQSFMKTGHGEALAKQAEKEDRQIRRFAKEDRPQTLTSLARSLEAFSENIATVRVPEIITGNGIGSARKVVERIDASEAEVERFFKPLYPLLTQLKSKLNSIPAQSLFNSEGYASMLALAKLYIDYQRYPEAAIVLREGWVSLYAAKDRTTDDLMSKPERHAAETRWNEAEGQHTNEGFADLLGAVRNDIQHGGFRPDPVPAQTLIKKLGTLLRAFAAKLGVNPLEGSYPEKTDEDADHGNASIPGEYLAALTIGEKATQGFKIVIEDITNQDDQGFVLQQRIDGRTFIVGTNDQNLIVAVQSYLAVKKSFF